MSANHPFVAAVGLFVSIIWMMEAEISDCLTIRPQPIKDVAKIWRNLGHGVLDIRLETITRKTCLLAGFISDFSGKTLFCGKVRLICETISPKRCGAQMIEAPNSRHFRHVFDAFQSKFPLELLLL